MGILLPVIEKIENDLSQTHQQIEHISKCNCSGIILESVKTNSSANHRLNRILEVESTGSIVFNFPSLMLGIRHAFTQTL